MEISNEKLLAGARNLKNKGFSKEQVDAWLQSKGSSLNDMRAFVKKFETFPKGEETVKATLSHKGRPVLDNDDGSYSTERNIITEADGTYYITPTIINGKEVSKEDAQKHFMQTGEHFGGYSSLDAALAAEKRQHDETEKYYEDLRRKQAFKPLTEDQKAKSSRSWLDVAGNFINDFKSGFIEGSQYGTERLANGATLGLYDKANEMLGGDAKERAQTIRSRAEAEGLGGVNNFLESGLDFIGGLAPTAGIYNKVSKVAKPVMAMALSTGIEQGARNAIDSRSLKDAGMKGAIGFGQGFAEGGTLGAGFKLAKGAYYLTKGATQRGLNYLKQEIGEEALNNLINKAKEQGRTLVEVIDDNTGGKLGDVIGKAQKLKEDASDYIKSKIPQIRQNSRDKVNGFIDDFFGEANGFDNVEAIKKAVDTEAKPAWEFIYSQGDVSLKNPELAKMLRQDTALRNVIKEVKHSKYIEPEFKNLPMGHIRNLEKARQYIYERTKGLLKKDTEKFKRDELLALQNRFLPKVKAATNGYGEVLEKYGDFHKIDEATEKAANFFKDSNPKQFAKEYAKFGEAERDAYKLGIKDEMEKLVGKKSEKAVWETITAPNMQAKIKTVFGEKDGERLIKYAEEEAERLKRFKKIENFSQEEPKAPKPFIFNRAANQALDVAKRVSLREKKSGAMGIAELLTNSKKLEKAIKNNSEYLPVKLDKALQKYLGKDYLPVSTIQGILEYNRNNKF